MLLGMPLGSFYNSLEESSLSRVVGCPSTSVSIGIGVGVGGKGGEEGPSDGMMIGVWLTTIGVSIVAGACPGGGGGLGVLGASIGLCLGAGVFTVIVVIYLGSGSFHPISFYPIYSRPISFLLISHFPLATR